MIQSRYWKRGTAFIGLLAGSAAFAQPVGYDFNDDGYSDYPVSIISYDAANPDVGAARIWSGASKAIIHTIVGTDTNTLFGWSTGSAGDLNGDGKDDLIVGEPLWSTPQSQDPTFQGRLKVFSGADASTLLTINGPYVDAAIGRYVIGVGDWDGDGTIDIASSGWDIADTDSDGIGDDPIGMVFIFSGADGSVLTEIFDPASTSGFGYSVYALGDVSGDGKADIAVVDQHIETSPGSGVFGQLYIFEGSDTETAYDLSDAYRTISNTDPTIRGYAAQVDVMHPDLWLDEPTLQILNLTNLGTGGVNEAEIEIDIIKANGVQTGTKGTRPSLKLAGDINLDGKVDATDIQDSISQLGTNPQAVGVMPIADSNGDNIIDATDIQVVVNGYGATTDIYEGLWDGSRLLSLAAGSAGFGSTSNVSIRPGGTNFGGGRRPIDDCLRSTTPPSNLNSIVPDLLRIEATDNCDECPDCDDLPMDCYECGNAGNLTGGEVSVEPSQPKPNEEITWTITAVEINGATRKCKDDCGPEGTECDLEFSPRRPPYKLFKKDAGDPDWVDITSASAIEAVTPDGPWKVKYTTSVSCRELKLETEDKEYSVGWGCDPQQYTGKESECKVADFRVLSITAATTPANRTRTTLGIGEVVAVYIDPADSQNANWSVDGNPIGTGPAVQAVAGNSAGTLSVVAEINGCEREMTFTVVEPSSVNYVMCPGSLFHTGGLRQVGMYLQIDLDPDTVSFYRVQIREVSGPGTGGTGDYAGVEPPHAANPNYSSIRQNNVMYGYDTAAGVDTSSNVGSFQWVIPIEYRVVGSATTGTINNAVTQKFTLTPTCITVDKGNGTATGCSTNATTITATPCP